MVFSGEDAEYFGFWCGCGCVEWDLGAKMSLCKASFGELGGIVSSTNDASAAAFGRRNRE